jgi:hypothetical protein
MRLESPDPPKHTVEDYDFVFSSGQLMPITVDREAGDEVSFDQSPLAIIIKLAAKPSLANPDVMLPAEEVTIFQNHLISIQKRTRLVQSLTHEQKEQWRDVFKGPSKAIN